MLFVWTGEKRFLDRILNPTSPLSPGSFFPSHSDYWWGPSSVLLSTDYRELFVGSFVSSASRGT